MQNVPLEGRRALVTGGAVRVGRAIIQGLSRAGAAVAIHYRSSARDADALADACRAGGRQAVSVQADLVSEQACVDLMKAVHEQLGGCDILVNNAALFNRDRMPETTFEKIETEFWPNCWAPLFLTREFALRHSGTGDVINLLDRRIQTLDTACVPYLLSKKTLAEITRLAALEYAPRIRVNGIAPGAILPPPGESEAYLEQFVGTIPLGRTSSPEEVSEAVLHYLVQPSLTGQITFVDGGQHLLGVDHV